MLGFGSEFPIRQLEKTGQLRSLRGAMRQAWYPRAEVLALAASLSRSPKDARVATSPPEGGRRTRWTDGALIELLRNGLTGEGGEAARPRTAVDLVAETGITIARATRVHRFWLANDVHPTAARARQSVVPRLTGKEHPSGTVSATVEPEPVVRSPPPVASANERRGPSRIERDGLIRELRDPDPAVRARAFEKLRPARKP